MIGAAPTATQVAGGRGRREGDRIDFGVEVRTVEPRGQAVRSRRRPARVARELPQGVGKAIRRWRRIQRPRRAPGRLAQRIGLSRAMVERRFVELGLAWSDSGP
jgi:hypothetical protein